MAFAPDPKDQQQMTAAPGAQGMGAMMAPVSTSAAPGAGPAAQPGSAPGSPSNKSPAQPFVNLQSYLTANAPKIQDEAQTIASNAGAQLTSAQNDINAGKESFAKDVAAGYTAPNAELVDRALADPTSFVKNPDDVAAFKAQAGDTYKGPANFEGSGYYADLNKKVQAAAGQDKLVNSPGGLQTYFQTTSPGSTSGTALLDSALLSSSPDAMTAVRAGTAPLSTLPDYLGKAADEGNQNVTAAQKAASGAQTDTATKSATAATNFKTKLAGELSDAEKKAQGFNANLNDITARLGNPFPVGTNAGIQPLSDEEQAGIGLNQSALDKYALANQILSDYQPTVGQPAGSPNSGGAAPNPIPLSSYLSGGHTVSMPTQEAVSTPEDYATAQALSALMDSGFAPPMDISHPEKAGTYSPTGQYQTFDTGSANKLVDQVNSMDKALADTFFANNTTISAGDYPAALQKLQADIAAQSQAGQPTGSGALSMLAALNRIVNGFTAPTPGYTPPAPQPSLGGPTTVTSGGGRATR